MYNQIRVFTGAQLWVWYSNIILPTSKKMNSLLQVYKAACHTAAGGRIKDLGHFATLGY